jgi:arsenite/tail-anchored protein-transporting ATPase
VRTLLFTGPGGSGTTTLAASAAVLAAKAGRRTLLLSRQTLPVPGLDEVPGLTVVTADPQAAMERLWSGSAGAVGATVPHLTLPPASSVVPLPGAADLTLFTELAAAEAELVVVDAGPPEAATALVGLPATLRWWIDQLLPPGVRALGAVRTAAVTSGVVRRGPVDAALAAVPVLERLLARNRLADPADTALVLVAAPRQGTGAAARRAATTLALHGLRPSAVMVRVLTEAGTGPWWAQRHAEQQAALAELAGIAPVRQVVEDAVGPADVAALAGLLGDFEPATAPPAVAVTERRDGTWQLSVPLPFAERSAVDVTRWRDDLVITAFGIRRSVRLDALLRRCEVTAGRLTGPGTADARLEVSFQPDPQLWPADLLAAEGRTS